MVGPTMRLLLVRIGAQTLLSGLSKEILGFPPNKV